MKEGAKMIWKFFKTYYLYLLIFVIICVPTCRIIYSDEFYILDYKDRLDYVMPLIGWFIAFSLLILQLNKNRQDNDEIKKLEIKKTLQIEAYRQINISITECSKIFTEIYVYYSMLPNKLKIYSQDSNFNFQSFILPCAINQYFIDLHKGHSIYKGAIEANKIAITEFDHLDTKIFLEVHRLSCLINEFRDFILKNSQQSLLKEKKGEFAQKSNEISQMMLDIQCYLHDFRIILMNYFLEDIFDVQVSGRVPNDKNTKTLSEIASNKEEVQKEFEELEKSLIFPQNTDSDNQTNSSG